MSILKTLRIVSNEIKISIPKEANFRYLNTDSLDHIKNVLSKTRWFSEGLEITEEDKEVPYYFDSRIYLEPNIDILCYVGDSYPRHTKNGDVHYGCWYLYEFGGWVENVNTYYNENGTFRERVSL